MGLADTTRCAPPGGRAANPSSPPCTADRKGRRWLLASLACCAFGLGVDTLWCILMGYTPAFIPADDAGFWANPRIFYLAGVLTFTFACIALPGRVRGSDKVLRFVLPPFGSAATVCFSLSSKGVLGPSDPLVLIGLSVAGAVQFWIMARFILMLARTQGVRATIICTASWLVVRLVLVELVDSIPNANVQIGCAIAAPLAAALLFEVACVFMRRAMRCSAENESRGSARTVFGVPQHTCLHQPATKNEQLSMCLLLFIAAVVLAAVRSVSYMGLWGTTNATLSEVSPWLLGILVPSLAIVVFVSCALMLPGNLPLAARFQPALFLTLGGLFAVAIQSNPSGSELMALETVVQVCQLFAHLLYWTVIATALDVLNLPSYRIVGGAEATYAAASIAWIATLADAPAIMSLIVLFALYILVIGMLWVVWGLSTRWGRNEAAGTRTILKTGSMDANKEGAGHAGAVIETTAKIGANTGAMDAGRRAPARSMLERCMELAVENRLSPRETEVFLLLVQGRSHSFIQEELGLASSTVKTHVSHIYTKMGVKGRQELLDLMWRQT